LQQQKKEEEINVTNKYGKAANASSSQSKKTRLNFNSF